MIFSTLPSSAKGRAEHPEAAAAAMATRAAPHEQSSVAVERRMLPPLRDSSQSART